MTPGQIDTVQVTIAISACLGTAGAWAYFVVTYLLFRESKVAAQTQLKMWQEYKRQNDFETKPVLRLSLSVMEPAAAEPFWGSPLAGIKGPQDFWPRWDSYIDALPSDWQQYKTTTANLQAIPDPVLEVKLENVGRGMAAGFKLIVSVTVKPLAGDTLTEAKVYKLEQEYTGDLKPSASGTVNLARLRHAPILEATVTLSAIQDLFGEWATFKADEAPTATVSFTNHPLIKVISPPLI